MTVNVNYDDLEFAGGMKFRILDVQDDDYTSGTPFTPSDANLNRFQHVAVNASGTNAQTANYRADEDEIVATDGGTEVAANTTVNYKVLAIGK